MAAGLGFKTFTTGEVLTAADTNGYLMQGVLVFASAAARDAAITSPQEGQCCYLKDTDAVLTYSGAAWVGFDDTNAIQNTIVDAKGDLIAASAADTPARLAVGNNGETLVADSSATTGLRYQGSMAGGKNPLINGGMDIWQRGTTTTGATGGTNGYAADRWQIYRAGYAAGSTLTRQATNDTTNLPFIQYCARVQRDSGNTSTAGMGFSQNLESSMSIPYAGKSVVLSFYARKGTNYSAASDTLTATLKNGTGTDQNGTTGAGYTGVNTVISQGVTLTTTWQRFSVTGTIPTNSTEFLVDFGYAPVGTASTNDYYEITGIQIEVGSVATQFTRAGGTIQGELAACQRYFEMSYNQGTTPANGAGSVSLYNTTAYATGSSRIPVSYKVQKRSSPTITFYRTTLGVTAGVWTYYPGSWTDATSTSVPDANTNIFIAELSKTAGFTVGNSYLASGDWTSSAEL